MLLQDRTAVVYGGGGFVGSAVAAAFAREGARVFLAGRTKRRLDRVAGRLAATGAAVDTAAVDAADEQAVEAHADAVVAATGGIDVWFNALAYADVQGAPLAELTYDQMSQPVAAAVRTQFVTVRAAARRMAPRGSGVILSITGYGPPFPSLGGTAVAWQTVEGLLRQFACELGPSGVRVAWLRTGGFFESIVGAAAYDSLTMIDDGEPVPMSAHADEASGEEEVAWLAEQTMLRRLPTLAEAGDAAVFLASDAARSVTATAVNLTAGAVAD